MDEPKIEDEDPFEDSHHHFKNEQSKPKDKVDKEPRKVDIFNDPLLPDEPKQ